MDAKDLVKWKWISVILTKNPNTVRADRNNKKHEEKVGELLDFIQGWIDEQLVKSDVKILVKVPETMEDVNGLIDSFKNRGKIANTEEFTGSTAKVRKMPKTNEPDFVFIDAMPTDRKLLNSPGLKGLYSSAETQRFYTNKVIEGKLEIREWSDLDKAKKYLESIK